MWSIISPLYWWQWSDSTVKVGQPSPVTLTGPIWIHIIALIGLYTQEHKGVVYNMANIP